MKLTSPAFEHKNSIPRKFTCDGDGISPELRVEGTPEGAKSLAIIMDDPDAPGGMFVHWVVWNLPADKTSIAEGESPGTEGRTDFGRNGYGGPCPPAKHRYFFKLYALDTELDLTEGSSKQQLEEAMEGHILEKAELMGTYERV